MCLGTVGRALIRFEICEMRKIHVALWCMGHHGTMSDNALLAVVIIVIESCWLSY